MIAPKVRRQIHRDIERVERQWRYIQKSNEHVACCTLADAQFFGARCHGFTSWPKFVKHLEALTRVNSPVSRFELAADAIVNGYVVLSDNPEHRSTLLHYISANGIEDFRQKTPKNIVEIAKLLLDAGADELPPGRDRSADPDDGTADRSRSDYRRPGWRKCSR
jgi:hypothetical protein